MRITCLRWPLVRSWAHHIWSPSAPLAGASARRPSRPAAGLAMAKRLMSVEPITEGWVKTDCVPHIFGELPTQAPTRGSQDSEART
jgi:hypothetical protein